MAMISSSIPCLTQKKSSFVVHVCIYVRARVSIIIYIFFIFNYSGKISKLFHYKFKYTEFDMIIRPINFSYLFIFYYFSACSMFPWCASSDVYSFQIDKSLALILGYTQTPSILTGTFCGSKYCKGAKLDWNDFLLDSLKVLTFSMPRALHTFLFYFPGPIIWGLTKLFS